MRSIKFDWFLAALLATLVVALALPAPFMSGAPLRLDLIARYGVAVVFFLYGLMLAPEKLRAGLDNKALQLLVVAGTFLLFPAIILAVRPLLERIMPPDAVTGFFYLAVLPSTISSSVALTSLARGNVPAAIFAASLSSLIGVFLTPLAVAWYVSSGGHAIALGPVFLKVLLLVVAPIVAGQLLHRPLLGWSARHASKVKLADRLIILAIVLNSLADAAGGGIWAHDGPKLLTIIAVTSIALFGIVFVILWGASAALGFSLADRIACTFCGSKKSLATGIPMAAILFGRGPATGLIVTPIILFHFLQLVIVSIIASRVAERPDDTHREIGSRGG